MQYIDKKKFEFGLHSLKRLHRNAL